MKKDKTGRRKDAKSAEGPKTATREQFEAAMARVTKEFAAALRRLAR